MTRSSNASPSLHSDAMASAASSSASSGVAVPAAAAAATSTRPASASKPQPFWLGGVASMGAACCSHPLDLLKVRLQCATSATVAPGGAPAPREGLVRLVGTIIRTDGLLSLYNGLSASLLRQGTYSTVRFGCYEALKERRLAQLRSEYAAAGSSPHAAAYPKDLSMLDSIAFAVVSGSLGGVAGNPADLVNVRMQNDRKLPAGERRNYRNVFHGLATIARTDGVAALWNGVGPNVMRAALMTTGQLASYDVFKRALVERGCSEKHIGTHLTASCLAGVVATVITQPVDVIKTRVMNSGSVAAAPCGPPGGPATSPATAVVRPSPLNVAKTMLATEGPQAFFKGFIPALTRLGPHTVATFVLLEQLKKLV